MLRSSLVVVVLAAAASIGACTVHNYHSGPPPRQANQAYAENRASAPAPGPAPMAPTRVEPHPLDPYAATAFNQLAPCERRCDCSRPEAYAADAPASPRGPVTPREVAPTNPADLLE